MIALERHIEILLLENECVIVPDFGGFMTHRIPARYDENDRMFVPPVRTLGFNPQLNINDSVLAQSYVEAYDISYPEALRRIESEVSELKQHLQNEGSYELNDIGTLALNEDGNYVFTPCEAGILSPDLYGLSGFNFKRLKDVEATVKPILPEADHTATEIALEPSLLEFTDSSEENSEQNDTIAIKMSWIRNAVAVAAAILAFFLMATPVTNSDLGNQAISNLQGNILYKLIPQDTSDVPAAKPVVEDTIKTVKVQPTPSYTYYIILASQVKKSNAESFVATLLKEGYEDAKVMVDCNTVRVSCGSFATEAEAYEQLKTIKSNPKLREAWVFKKKTEV